MPTTFSQSQTINLTSVETILYTAPNETTTLIFSGAVVNKDSEQAVVKVNIKKNVDGITSIVLNNAQIMNGTTLIMPKIVLPAGGKLIASTDKESSGKVDITLELLEMTKATL